MRNRRVIIYARVSTGKQSTDNQVEMLRKKALSEGFAPDDTLELVEEPTSGGAKREKRVKLVEAMRLLRLQEYNILMVYSLDRVSRSLIDLLDIAECAKNEHWDIVTLDGWRIDTRTINGQLLLGFMALLAQYERQRIRERIVDSIRAMREAGAEGLVSTATEWKIVELRNAGRSYPEIVSWLDRNNVPTARGGAWNPSGIRKICERNAALLTTPRLTKGK